MPSRMVRGGFLASDRVATLSAEEERLYFRLFLIVDDYGLSDARTPIIKAKAFPLHSKISTEDIEKWMEALVIAGLVERYTAQGKPYIHVLNFNQRMRILRSNCPLPPSIQGSPFALEEDLCSAIASSILSSGKFCGHKVVGVRHQVRLEASYMDLVVDTEKASFVLEVKRTKLSDKSLDQVLDYAARSGYIPVLIGADLYPSCDLTKSQKKNCAVLTYSEDFAFKLVTSNREIKRCDIDLKSVISQLNKSPLEEKGREVEVEVEGKRRGRRNNGLPALNPRPNFLPPNWETFEAQRANSKNPMSVVARDELVRKIGRLVQEGYDVAAIVQDSIENDWRGLFEKPKHKLRKGQPTADAISKFLDMDRRKA